MNRLGIVVATPRARGDFERAAILARAARAARVEVAIFLMADAAVWAEDPRAAELVEDGCDVTVCGTNFADRHPAPGVVVGSQDDHAALVRWSDRLVALT